MARRKMVTRSFAKTTVKAIVFNNETNATGEVEHVLTGSFNTEAAIMKTLRKMYENNPKIVPLKVSETSVVSELYGVPEEDFLKIAEKLENRNNKTAEDNEETAEDNEDEN